jgi:hypothetical protein
VNRDSFEMAANLKDTYEGRILLALLAQEFPGSAELREQVRVVRAERVMADGDPVLLFKFDQPVPRADVRYRIPVECWTIVEGPTRIHGERWQFQQDDQSTYDFPLR